MKLSPLYFWPLLATTALLTLSCLGEDSVDFVPENTVARCTDGQDNDGNGHFDCYDPACRELSERRFADGLDSVRFCIYTRVLVPTQSSEAPVSSAVISSSSSSEGTSSSEAISSSSEAPTFPVLITETGDTAEIRDLTLLSNGTIAFAGRRRQQGLVGRADTTGAVLFTFSTPTYNSDSEGSSQGARLNTVQANGSQLLLGGVLIYGQNRALTLDFNLSTQTAVSPWTLVRDSAEMWMAAPAQGDNRCLSFSDRQTVGAVDQNGWLTLVDPTSTEGFNLPYNLPNGQLRRGSALSSGGCAAVGFVDSSASRATMHIGQISAQNTRDWGREFTAGGTIERAYDLVITSTGFAITAEVDGQVQVILLNNAGLAAASGGDLGAGIPHRMIVVSGGGFLVTGSAAGVARIWRTDASGALVTSLDLPGQVASSAVQLPSGDFLVSGYSHADGSTWIRRVAADLSAEVAPSAP